MTEPRPADPVLAHRAAIIGARIGATVWPSERAVAGWLIAGRFAPAFAPGEPAPPLARFATRPAIEPAMTALLDAAEARRVDPSVLIETVHRLTEGKVSAIRSVNSWSRADTDGPVHMYAPPDTVRPGLKDLCRQINAETDGPPVLDALHIHAATLRLHPFTDGNGRLSRALFNATLTAHGLPRPMFPLGPLLYAEGSRFVRAIRAVSQSQDWLPYLAYMLALIDDGIAAIDRCRAPGNGATGPATET